MYGENLKKLRFELKMSARELSEKIGVSTGSIQNYEAGKREPNYNFMQILCQKLNVNLNWFVTGNGEMFIKQDNIPHQIDEAQIEKIFDNLLKKKGII